MEECVDKNGKPKLRLVGKEADLGAHTEPEQEAAAEKALLRKRMGQKLTRQEEQVLRMVYGINAGHDHALTFEHPEKVKDIEARALARAQAQRAAESILTPVTD